MKVYCYHYPINGSGAEPVIELWRDNWKSHGWEPLVLSEQDVCKLPFFSALEFKARMLPSYNCHAYEKACYIRWLAMAGQGGGMMTDYDVMNFGFRPEDLPAYKGKLIRFDRFAPCAVFGRTWDYLQAVDMFLSYTTHPTDDYFGDKLRVSDMTILNRYPHIADYHDICTELNPKGNKSQLVHCASRHCGERKKAEVIKELLAK